jgi:hypothetical protein
VHSKFRREDDKLLSIRPEITSLGFLDGVIVGTHVTPTHEPVLLELPQLISMRPKPANNKYAPTVEEDIFLSLTNTTNWNALHKFGMLYPNTATHCLVCTLLHTSS